MIFQSRLARLATIGLMAFAMAGCASHYDRKSSNTLMGAGLGGAAGAVLSGGDPLYTIGGAAAGGVLGNILTDDDRRDRRRSRNWDRGRDHREYGNRYRGRDNHRYLERYGRDSRRYR